MVETGPILPTMAALSRPIRFYPLRNQVEGITVERMAIKKLYPYTVPGKFHKVTSEVMKKWMRTPIEVNSIA